MSQIVCVHSFRSDTGKSVVAANLATQLAMRGLRVAIVDIDFEAPGMNVLFNLDISEMANSLNDYLWGKCEINHAAYDVTGRLGIDIIGRIFFIPTSMNAGEIARILREGYDVGLLNDGLRTLLKSLNLDILIIKTHAGLREESLLSIAISHTLVEIMRPDARDYEGAMVMIDTARKLEVPRILLVINKIPLAFDLDDLRNQVHRTFDCEVAAMLPLSDEIVATGGSGMFSLQYPNHNITIGLKHLTEQILNT